MSASYYILRTFDEKYYVELRSGTGKVFLRTEHRCALSLARASITSLRFICDSHVEDTLGVLGEPTDTLSYPKYKVDRRGRGIYILSIYARNGKCVARAPELSTPGALSETLIAIRRAARYAPNNEKIINTYE